MSKYKTPDGNIIVATQEYVDAKFPGSSLVEEPPEYIPPAPAPSITKLEYMGRFTDSELISIYTAAKSNVAIEVWLEKFKLAAEIYLQDQRTIDGLNALAAAGILTSERVSVILGGNQ